MPSEPDDHPLAPAAARLPTESAVTGPTATLPSDGFVARGDGPMAAGGVDPVLEKLDEFLGEIERALAALGDGAAPAA